LRGAVRQVALRKVRSAAASHGRPKTCFLRRKVVSIYGRSGNLLDSLGKERPGETRPQKVVEVSTMKCLHRAIFGALLAYGLLWLESVLAQSLSATMIGPGWQCLLIPSSFDGPGTLFSVNGAGEKSRIADLRALKLIPVRTGRAVVGKISNKSAVGGDIVIALLEKSVRDLGLRLKAEGTEITGATVEFANVEEETTYETEVDLVFDDWFREHVSPKAGVRYFLVRDAYVAGSVSYDLAETDVIKAGGEIKFKKIFETNVTVFRHEGQSTYKLDQILDPPLRVCIRASEVLATRSDSAFQIYHLSQRIGQVPSITRAID
jgi:hypothetical protein